MCCFSLSVVSTAAETLVDPTAGCGSFSFPPSFGFLWSFVRPCLNTYVDISVAGGAPCSRRLDLLDVGSTSPTVAAIYSPRRPQLMDPLAELHGLARG